MIMQPRALMWGNSPSTNSTWLFRIDFHPHPCSQLPYILFCWQDNMDKITAPISKICSPNTLTLQHHPLPYLPIPPFQGKIHAVSRHYTLTKTVGGTYPLCFANFSSCTHLVIPSLLPQPGRVTTPLDAVKLPMKDLYNSESNTWCNRWRLGDNCTLISGGGE